MSAKVDVLAVLDRIAPFHHPIDRLEVQKARAAIAELIAADREYDATKHEYDSAWMDGNDAFNVWHARMESAKQRRAAALAAVGGEGQG